MDNIKVSVIVPVYNVEKYLSQCLDTIVNQTLRDIEIICVDDSSTDGSLAILEKYANEDSRIKIVNNIHTGYGASSARKAGFDVAQGEYLSFLDSDDYFDLNLLEKVYTRAEEFDADVVVYDAQYFDSNTGSFMPSGIVLNQMMLPKKDVFSAKEVGDYIFLFTVSTFWQTMLKKEYVIKEELKFQSINFTDDVLFIGTAFACANRMTIIPEKLVYYRTHIDTNQTAKANNYPLSAPDACLALKNELVQKGMFEELRNAFANYAVRFCAWYLDSLTSYESFEILYTALATKYFELFELKQSFKRNLWYIDGQQWIDLVSQNNIGNFIFTSTARGDATEYKFDVTKKFPADLVTNSDRVVLYGAGATGKAYYIQNVVKGFCNIVAWVDKSAKDLYSPIEEIEYMFTKDFDKVIIAIENIDVCNVVKAYLVAKGVSENNIFVSNVSVK